MAAEGAGGTAAILAVLWAAGAIVFALLSRGSASPAPITLLAALATLGVFLVFAFAAGLIRIAGRRDGTEVLSALVDGLDDAVMVTDRQGKSICANRAFTDLVGRDASGRPGSLESLFFGEPEGAEALYRLTRAAEAGRAHREEFRLRELGDGAERTMRIAVRPLRSGSAAPQIASHMLWQIADISAERDGDAAAGARLRSVLAQFDDGPVGLILADEDGAVSHINATFARWLGRTPADAGSHNLTLSDILASEDLARLQALTQQPSAVPAGIDLDVTVEGGRALPLRLFCSRSAGGLVIAAHHRDGDPPAGRDADPAEVRFTRFFRSAPFGIATVGRDGQVMSANAAFARLTNYAAGSGSRAAADVLCRFVEPETRALVESALQQALGGNGTVAPVEITAGEQRQFTRRVYMSPLSPSARAREAAVLYVLDATEQKTLEAKFAQSQKMEAVGKLAGGIAHDFNNILTAIIGFSDLLLQTHRPTDPAYMDIRNIKSSAERAAGLVRNLLGFSRQQTQQKEVLQLGEVLTDLGPLLKRSIGEKIELKVQPGRDLWVVMADRTQFVQVVLNLTVNASDAMPDGGTLIMRTRNVTERESQKLVGVGVPVGEYVLIEVEDTGVGMSPEVMARIFEPFYTTKAVGKGTGLGLATVYGVVQQSGGYIVPESTPGKGTIFRVYLPRHYAEPEDEAATQKTPKKERQAATDLTGSGRVLLVEDEDVVRSFAVRALKSRGYEVLEASTGVEALQVMEKNEGRIDLVVSDVVMPEMDGPTLLKEMRRTNPDLKFIFVSGYPNEAFQASLDEREVFAFLPKPFSLPQLAAKVKEELGR